MNRLRHIVVALGIFTVAGTVHAGKTIDCYCRYSGITDRVEVLEGETPIEACQTLGRGFVPLHD